MQPPNIVVETRLGLGHEPPLIETTTATSAHLRTKSQDRNSLTPSKASAVATKVTPSMMRSQLHNVNQTLAQMKRERLMLNQGIQDYENKAA